jgi:exodeoxyribonuclease V
MTVTSFSLTPAQATAKDKIKEFVHKNISSPEAVFRMSGKAGTGKTTTAIDLIRELKEEGFEPVVCTPTGKAAHVLNKKDPTINAITIHRALSVRPFDTLQPIHSRLNELERKAEEEGLTDTDKKEETELLKRLDQTEKSGKSTLQFEPITHQVFVAGKEKPILICDESSMIGLRNIYNPLMSHIKVPKIFLGDEAQLPPVNDEPAIDLKRSEVSLKEILRQKAGSGILKFAHGISVGKVMSKKEASAYSDLTILNDCSVSLLRPFMQDHQLLCHTNKERHAMNKACREERGFDTAGFKKPYLPLPGETLMVDSNDYDLRVMRGQLLKVFEVRNHAIYNPYIATVAVDDEEGRRRSLKLNISDLAGPTQLCGDWQTDKKRRLEAARVGLAVQFAYTITVHKAQGSEWPKVAIVGSMMPESGGDAEMWWYTAATRASESLVVASYHYSHDRS